MAWKNGSVKYADIFTIQKKVRMEFRQEHRLKNCPKIGNVLSVLLTKASLP